MRLELFFSLFPACSLRGNCLYCSSSQKGGNAIIRRRLLIPFSPVQCMRGKGKSIFDFSFRLIPFSHKNHSSKSGDNGKKEGGLAAFRFQSLRGREEKKRKERTRRISLPPTHSPFPCNAIGKQSPPFFSSYGILRENVGRRSLFFLPPVYRKPRADGHITAIASRDYLIILDPGGAACCLLPFHSREHTIISRKKKTTDPNQE